MLPIAEAIGRGLGTEGIADAGGGAGAFGWLAMLTGLDMPVSGALTRERLDWRLHGPKLLEDLARMDDAVESSRG